MRILVGVDGSEASLAAVRFAAKFRVDEIEPLFLYYSPASIKLTQHGTLDAETLKRLEQSLIAAVFERAKEELPREQRENVIQVEGVRKAKQGLLIAADEHRVDMIVVGSHGNRPMDWLHLGSVSRHLAQTSNIPVVIVREGEASAATASSDHEFRVLVTCDRTKLADFPQSFVQHVSWPNNTVGEVITVFESYISEVPEWLQETLARESGLPASEHFEPFGEEKQKAQQAIERWCEDFPSSFRCVPAEVVEGHAAKTIVERLKSKRYDLVVVGSHRQNMLQRMLLGSTSYAVLNHAPCSVLIVPEHDES